jgi:Ricin-type beta-trefoil lectin domain
MLRIGKWAAAIAAAFAVAGWSAGTALAAPQAHAQAAAAAAVPHVKVINLHRPYAAMLGHAKPGKIAGITYPVGKQPKAAPRALAGCTEPDCPLSWGRGPVQHNPEVYLLFWGPNWFTDSSQAASAGYLENFYAGLGDQPDDSWSTITSQYGDGSGSPTFSGSVYEGAWQDSSTPPYGATQSQLASEADAFASYLGITDPNDTQIVIATQSGTCPSGFYSPGVCGNSDGYCAWHASSNEPYTNLPYLLDAGAGCGENFVNSGSNGAYDGFSIVGGHEYAESVTDPYPFSGWSDPSDTLSDGGAPGEIADKCAWGGEVYGLSDPFGDVRLSTGSFAMQSLWSNTAGRCVMSTGAAIKGYKSKCLDDRGAGFTNGNIVDIWSCNGTAAQQWTFNNGELEVALGKCLDNSSGGLNGTKLVLWTCNGHKAQTWTHLSNGEYVLESNGLCLTDPSDSTTNGTQVQIRTCKANADQKWSLP